MLHLDEYWIAFGLFVVLPLLSRPGSWRVLGRLATRVDDWAIARGRGTDDPDGDDVDLWLMYKRDKLSAELRRIPDVFPISFQPQALDSWDESQVERLWRAPAVNGYSAQSPTVEILDIGWGHYKG